MTYFLARANQAEEAIERVRELHQTEKDNPKAEWCEECFAKYPCPTIKALDAKDD